MEKLRASLLEYKGSPLYIGLGSWAPFFYRQIHVSSLLHIFRTGETSLVLLFDREYGNASRRDTYNTDRIKRFFEQLFRGAEVNVERSLFKKDFKKYNITIRPRGISSESGRGQIILILISEYMPTNDPVAIDSKNCKWYSNEDYDYYYERDVAINLLKESPIDIIVELATHSPRIALNNQAIFSTGYKPYFVSMIKRSDDDMSTHSIRNIAVNTFFENTTWVLAFLERFPKTYISIGPSVLIVSNGIHNTRVLFYGEKKNGGAFLRKGCDWEKYTYDIEDDIIENNLVNEIVLRDTGIQFSEFIETRPEEFEDAKEDAKDDAKELVSTTHHEDTDYIRDAHAKWRRERDHAREHYKVKAQSDLDNVDKLRRERARRDVIMEAQYNYEASSLAYSKSITRDGVQERDLFGRWEKFLPKFYIDRSMYDRYYEEKKRIAW